MDGRTDGRTTDDGRRTDGRTDRRTDGRMDGRTNRVIPIYPPNFVCGGIQMQIAILLFNNNNDNKYFIYSNTIVYKSS